MVLDAEESLIAFKTFCDYDRKVKLPRYMESVWNSSLCNPIEGSSYEAWLPELPEMNPKRWQSFQSITETTLGSIYNIHSAIRKDQAQEAERAIEALSAVLRIPETGWTLDEIDAVIQDAGIDFPLNRTEYHPDQAAFYLQLYNKGLKSNDDGYPLIHSARINRK